MIQLTHYPAFHFVSEKDFVKFHSRHTAVMGAVVGPVMIIELLTAILLLKNESWLWQLNLLGVVLIWITTFFRSVPLHRKLSLGHNAVEIQKLVRSNWLRTVIWSVRAVLFLGIILNREL